LMVRGVAKEFRRVEWVFISMTGSYISSGVRA
jgi:hypothetical protein